MNEPPRDAAWKIAWQVRAALALIGLGLATLLVVAAVLRPSPSGHGTHQQLGLPPCTFQVLWTTRCPSCGMTTSWSWMVRGRIAEAFSCNAGGALLALAALLTAPWSLLCAARGRWLVGRPNEMVVLGVLGAIFLVTLADWIFRLMVA